MQIFCPYIHNWILDLQLLFSDNHIVCPPIISLSFRCKHVYNLGKSEEKCSFFRYMRAVGYRWVARYLFGYMGWDNTRPLPACIYHHLRSQYPTHESKGYLSAQDRAWGTITSFTWCFNCKYMYSIMNKGKNAIFIYSTDTCTCSWT